MILNTYLIDAFKNLGKSQSEIVKDLKKSQPYVSALMNGKKTVGKDVAKQLALLYDFDVASILIGEGNMLKETPEITKAPEGRFPKTTPNNAAAVAYYDIDFAAGNDIAMFDSNLITPAYYMDIPEFSGCTAFRAYSDSMEPMIKSGSVLFATKIDSWQEHLEFGQVYGLVCNDGRRYLKYIRKAEKHETHFLLRSHNEEHDDFDIPKSVIRGIWLIHGWINKRV